MSNVIFVLGGARSGKSDYALSIARHKNGKNAYFIATCQALDDEMKKRITLHQNARPNHWKTVEAPFDVSGAVKKIGKGTGAIIIDCITLLVSNLMLRGDPEMSIIKEAEKIVVSARKSGYETVIVSNEVGMGIVPENESARRFRDIAGRVNQFIAKKADIVYLMISGLAWRIK